MINIYKLKFTNLQQEILRLLFVRAGKTMNQRQIAKVLGVSPPAVMKAIPQMEEDGLIVVQQDNESKRWSIEMNRDSRRVMQLKRADNLKLIYESGLFDYIEHEFAGATIILFGSYSRGEDIISSDIDLAVIGRKDKVIDLDKFEKALEREININFYDSFSNIHKHLRESLYNGIILVGGIEL